MKLYKFEDTKLPDNISQTLAKMITSTEKKLIYQKVAKGQYKMYCPYCQKYKLITYDELKNIRSTRTKPNPYSSDYIECPICEHKFDSTTNRLTHKVYDDYVRLEIDGNDVGYHVVSEWTFGEPIKLISADQYAIFQKDETYVKCGYALVCYGKQIAFNPDYYSGYYRKAVNNKYYGGTGYGWACFDYYSLWNWYYGTRADKRKCLIDAYHVTKSSQHAVVYQTNCPADYVYAIKLFNINSVEEYEKYYPYLHKNKEHFRDWGEQELNIHYLDYLSRNDIDLGEYFTYSQNVKKLGFKLDKPTDFKFRFDKVEDMVTAEKDKGINERIKERYDELPKYAKDNVLIYPFKRAQDIRNCGKSLHNCIGGYVERYANKTTDIYRLDLDGRLTAALEIMNGKLKQAYEDHNTKCSEDVLNHIKSFCKKNGFSLGTYA